MQSLNTIIKIAYPLKVPSLRPANLENSVIMVPFPVLLLGVISSRHILILKHSSNNKHIKTDTSFVSATYLSELCFIDRINLLLNI